MLDLIGHLGYLLIFLGTWQLGKRNKIGWILRFIGELLWVCLGFSLNFSSIYLWGIIFLVMDIINYVKWNKDE